MTTPQPQQQSLQVAELTPEQEKRFDKKFPPFTGTGAPFPMFRETPNINWVKAHLATELALQRREYEVKIKEYFGHVGNDGLTGKPMSVSIEEIEKDLLALLQKEGI